MSFDFISLQLGVMAAAMAKFRLESNLIKWVHTKWKQAFAKVVLTATTAGCHARSSLGTVSSTFSLFVHDLHWCIGTPWLGPPVWPPRLRLSRCGLGLGFRFGKGWRRRSCTFRRGSIEASSKTGPKTFGSTPALDLALDCLAFAFAFALALGKATHCTHSPRFCPGLQDLCAFWGPSLLLVFDPFHTSRGWCLPFRRQISINFLLLAPSTAASSPTAFGTTKCPLLLPPNKLRRCFTFIHTLVPFWSLRLPHMLWNSGAILCRSSFAQTGGWRSSRGHRFVIFIFNLNDCLDAQQLLWLQRFQNWREKPQKNGSACRVAPSPVLAKRLARTSGERLRNLPVIS